MGKDVVLSSIGGILIASYEGYPRCLSFSDGSEDQQKKSTGGTAYRKPTCARRCIISVMNQCAL